MKQHPARQQDVHIWGVVRLVGEGVLQVSTNKNDLTFCYTGFRFQSPASCTLAASLLPLHAIPGNAFPINWSMIWNQGHCILFWKHWSLLLQMALHRLFQLSSVLRSAVSLTLRRNIGMSAILFQRAKELDPVQKLFLDKIRDYKSKSKSVDLT